MPKDDLMYVGHMLDTARKIIKKAEGKARHEFDEDENLRLALAHLFQILGEAARRVSREFQESHPSIPWKAAIGMRHHVVHDYLNVDDDMVWSTAVEDLPPLVAALEKIVPPEN